MAAGVSCPLLLRFTLPMDTSKELQLDPDHRAAFGLAQQAASRVLRRRTRLLRLVARSVKKLSRNRDALERAQHDLRALIRLANAWAHRQYHNVPWRSILYATAALVYFVNPIDLIPDALLGIGFVDDLAVLSAVVRALRKDLTAFRTWEQQRGLSPVRPPSFSEPRPIALLDT
jgi:uncharacterized membrane protein YkvA (DUF1232 family)